MSRREPDLQRAVADHRQPDFYSTLTGGSRPITDAVREVLRYETPFANFGVRFAASR